MTWDSRAVKPGDLYVAFPGERVDGHDFVDAAMPGAARCWCRTKWTRHGRTGAAPWWWTTRASAHVDLARDGAAA